MNKKLLSLLCLSLVLVAAPGCKYKKKTEKKPVKAKTTKKITRLSQIDIDHAQIQEDTEDTEESITKF